MTVRQGLRRHVAADRQARGVLVHRLPIPVQSPRMRVCTCPPYSVKYNQRRLYFTEGAFSMSFFKPETPVAINYPGNEPRLIIVFAFIKTAADAALSSLMAQDMTQGSILVLPFL